MPDPTPRRRPWRLAIAAGLTVAAITIAIAIGGHMSLERTFTRELAAAGLAASGQPGPIVTEADLTPLPATAQRYLRFLGVVGRPRDTSLRAHLTGRFRRSRGAAWAGCEAWQFNSRPDLSRHFYMRLGVLGIPVLGRDTYAGGQGRMLIRPLDLFTVEDARGVELDVGELVTWLNDAVLLAPSMLLGPGVTFAGVDDRSFDLSLTDRGTTVRARVFVDERGAPVDFETTDRFHEGVRTRWTTPVEGYREVGGRMLPSRGQAIWHFPEGPLPYAELRFEPGALAFNVAPGA